MAQLTEEEIYKYKKEIEYFNKQRQKFLTIGLILLGVGLLSFIISMILLYANGDFLLSSLLIYLMIFLDIGGIVMLILRSALYNARINNRKIALEVNEHQKQIDQKD